MSGLWVLAWAAMSWATEVGPAGAKMAAHLDAERIAWVVPGASRREGDGVHREPDRLILTDKTGTRIAEAPLAAGGWTASIAGGPGGVVVALGTVGKIMAFDPALRPRWTLAYPAGRVAVTPDGSQVLAFAAYRSEIRLVRADDGRTVWTRPIAGGIPSGLLVLSDGRFVHGDTGGTLSLRDLRTGDLLGSRQVFPEHVVEVGREGAWIVARGLHGLEAKIPLAEL